MGGSERRYQTEPAALHIWEQASTTSHARAHPRPIVFKQPKAHSNQKRRAKRVAVGSPGRHMASNVRTMQRVKECFSSDTRTRKVDLSLETPRVKTIRVHIIRHARTHYVVKYQSCMFLNVGLSVHAPVVCVGWLLSVADRVGG